MPGHRRPIASSLDRRSFLASAAFTAAAWSVAPAWGITRRQVSMQDYPFQLGVASGDPSPRGVVLWTRLAPDPLAGGGMPAENVEVSWQVCHDEQMTQVVRQGVEVATPGAGHSVHVEVDGLEPDRWYFYRFKAGNELSPVGRTRTVPLRRVMPDKLRFAFASCQHYETGFFTAYEHMAREDLDLVVHLGDYIYEGAARQGQPRQHVGSELHTLDDYRNRYAQYRTDPMLQDAHAAFPWLVTWDDHEFDNNYASDVSEEDGIDRDAFLARRAAAYQAYYEMMPLRRRSAPQGPDLRLYRRIGFGRLAQFAILDTRQYRTDQPCDDHNKPPCEAVYDPAATLLGDRQERWLLERLGDSPARWNVLAQQVMMARVDRTPGEAIAYSMDQWPGYEVARQRLLKAMHDRKVANPVVLTGDIHTNWVNDLKVDYDAQESPTVATEFVGTSITSGGDGGQTRADTAGVLAENPFVKFYNNERGYVRCEVTPKSWRTDFQVVPFITRPGAPQLTRASFVVENGRPGAQQV